MNTYEGEPLENAFGVDIIVSKRMGKLLEYADAKRGEDEQTSKDMQTQLFECCETDQDVLALLDHLITEGIPVPEIVSEIRLYDNATRFLALRAHFAWHHAYIERQQELTKTLNSEARASRSVVFHAPVLAGVSAL